MVRFVAVLAALSAVSLALAAPPQFEKAVRLKAGDKYIQTEAPGFAAPCLADLDRDGKPDLLVGQFKQGKICVYKGLGGLKFAEGEWLKAEGEVAQVPGVW